MRKVLITACFFTLSASLMASPVSANAVLEPSSLVGYGLGFESVERSSLNESFEADGGVDEKVDLHGFQTVGAAEDLLELFDSRMLLDVAQCDKDYIKKMGPGHEWGGLTDIQRHCIHVIAWENGLK